MSKTAYPIPLEFIRFLNQVLDLPIRDKDRKKKLDGAIRDINLIQKEFDESLNYFILQPIKKEISSSIANLLESHFRKMIEDYLHHIVKEIPVDGLSRDDIMKVLSSFIAKRCFDFLNNLPGEFRLSKQDIISLFNKEKFSVPFILSKMDENLDWVAYCHYSSDENKETIRRWKSCEYIPSVQAINLLFSDVEINKNWIRKMKFWLIVSRGFDELRRGCLSFFNNDLNGDVDIRTINKKINCLQDNKRTDFILKNYGFLHGVLDLDLKADKTEIQEKLEEAYKYLEKHNLLSSMSYHWDNFYARFYLFSGELDKAIEYYKKSFENALFRGGKSLKHIIKDSLIAASYRDFIGIKSDKKFLSHLKHTMILLDIEFPIIGKNFEKINHKDIIADFEMELWARNFTIHFPQEKLFEGVSYNELRPRNYEMSFTFDEIKSIKPDYRKPNKIINIKNGLKKLPQIVFYTMFNKCHSNEYVKHLLSYGADVNKLSSENESALALALDDINLIGMSCSFNYELVDILIDRDYTQETINAKYKKKQDFPLYICVQSGKYKYVKSILDKGAIVDEFHKVAGITSLVMVINMIILYKKTKKVSSIVNDDLMNLSPHAVESLRRTMGYASIPENFISQSIQRDDFANKMYETVSALSYISYRENLESYSSLDELYSIVELLLEYGANPNFEYNVRDMLGYTPLMLAVENNDRRLFDLLIKFGGDTLKPLFHKGNNKLYYCGDIKHMWNSDKIPL